ncbi:MAG: alpha/beta hydrolase [Sphingomonadales bacterium BRH_c42]|nr:MAG: alpha/beta hydrolase [Sphingomonadales bacterium BRH_c42]
MEERNASAYSRAETRTVTVDGIKYAFRTVGAGDHAPLVMLNHWGANLDNFDPSIVDGLSADRPVFALDYRGIGASEGAVRTTVGDSAADMASVIRAITPGPVDLFGFSLGGFVAQEIALTQPDLVRRMILAGTGPAGGEGGDEISGVTIRAILKALVTRRDPKYYLFFTRSESSRRAAEEFLARLNERTRERDNPVSLRAFLRQLKAIKAWSKQPAQPLDQIDKPVLIANGDADSMVPSEHSTDMARRIPNAELVLYPDAGHGSIFQYGGDFVHRARAFLSN